LFERLGFSGQSVLLFIVKQGNPQLQGISNNGENSEIPIPEDSRISLLQTDSFGLIVAGKALPRVNFIQVFFGREGFAPEFAIIIENLEPLLQTKEETAPGCLRDVMKYVNRFAIHILYVVTSGRI
jgi:hypothetical protein